MQKTQSHENGTHVVSIVWDHEHFFFLVTAIQTDTTIMYGSSGLLLCSFSHLAFACPFASLFGGSGPPTALGGRLPWCYSSWNFAFLGPL